MALSVTVCAVSTASAWLRSPALTLRAVSSILSRVEGGDSGQPVTRAVNAPRVLPLVLPVQADDAGPSGLSLARAISLSFGMGETYAGWFLLVGGIV